MAIATDATSNGGSGSGTSLSWSHTCTGSNLVLFVAVGISSTSDLVTGVTYNSVSMTRVGGLQSVGGATAWSYLYMLVNPASGSNTVAVSTSGSTTIGGLAASYTGAKQTGQPDSSNTGESNATSLTLSTSVVASNSWLVAVIRNDTAFMNAGTGTTERIEMSADFAMGIYDSNGTVGTGSQSLQATIGPTAYFWGVIASLAEVAGGGGGAKPRLRGSMLFGRVA